MAALTRKSYITSLSSKLVRFQGGETIKRLRSEVCILFHILFGVRLEVIIILPYLIPLNFCTLFVGTKAVRISKYEN